MTVYEYYVQDELLGEPRERPNDSGILAMEWVSIEFTDAHGRWSVTSGGMPQAVDDSYPAYSPESDLQLIPQIQFMDEQQQIDGCGG